MSDMWSNFILWVNSAAIHPYISDLFVVLDLIVLSSIIVLMLMNRRALAHIRSVEKKLLSASEQLEAAAALALNDIADRQEKSKLVRAQSSETMPLGKPDPTALLNGRKPSLADIYRLHLEGVSHADISRRLGVPLQAVRKHIALFSAADSES